MKAIIASIVLGLALTVHAEETKAPAAPSATTPAAASAQSAPVANTKTPVETAHVTTATKPAKKVAKVNFKKECKEKLGKEASKADVKKCVADMKTEAKATK